MSSFRAIPGFWRRRSRLEKSAALLLAATLLMEYLAGGRPAAVAVVLNLFTAGAFLALVFRYLRSLLSVIIWRLRNRLLITYLFIGVVPVLLMAGMAGIAAYIFYGQVATYMASSEVQKLSEELSLATRGVAADLAAGRGSDPAVLLRTHLRANLQQIVPQARLLRAGEVPGWLKTEFDGLVRNEEAYELRLVCPAGPRLLMVSVNLERALASWLSGSLGVTRLAGLSARRSETRPVFKLGERQYEMSSPAGSAVPLAPAAHWADIAVSWPFTVPVTRWDNGKLDDPALLLVQTRPSILHLRLFNTLGEISSAPLTVLAGVGILFLLIEGGALLVGVGLTRSITRAVNDLYEGTRRVNRGDFSYKIPVRSRDQLSALASSFNTMTVSLERLIAESKEHERLQSELEIAREVQNQLFPKEVPVMRGLELTGVCNAARVVSGDYYDFVTFDETRMALAIGDIAGKGISAALIMAGIQSALHAQFYQWRHRVDGNGAAAAALYSTAALVAQLNRQLYEATGANTFATFCYAVYDDADGRLTYTNAGHLPPLVVGREGVRRLDAGGLVLGVLPEAPYEQASLILHPGDLLVAYTDGITEPENSYGGEFGEERLLEVISEVRDYPPLEVAQAILDAVRNWSDSPEARDDMTLLVARRL